MGWSGLLAVVLLELAVPRSTGVSTPFDDDPVASSACVDPALGSATTRVAAASPLSVEQRRLEPALDEVLAFGMAHPESFAGYGLVWHDDSDASVYIALSGDVEAQTAQLEATVSYPDELVVCELEPEVDDLQRVRDAVEDLFRNRIAGVGGGRAGDDAVSVQLWGSGEQLAVELVMRYGARVDVSVGFFPYPMPDPLPAARCEFDEPTVTVPNLEVTIDPLDRPVSDEPEDGPMMRFRNSGLKPIEFQMGVASGSLLDPESGSPVGRFNGAIAFVGYGISLDPGEENRNFGLLTGLASCDPSLGYRVPPGNYHLIARIPAGSSWPAEDEWRGEIESEPVDVVVA